MTEPIPASLTTLVEVIRSVCAELGCEADFEPYSRNQWMYACDLSWEDSIDNFAFLLNVKAFMLVLYITLAEIPGATDHGDRLARALAYANYGMLPGCFEFNRDNGDLRYRCVLMPVSNDTNRATVAGVLSDALVMVQKYGPAFAKIVDDKADPIKAIDEAKA